MICTLISVLFNDFYITPTRFIPRGDTDIHKLPQENQHPKNYELHFNINHFYYFYPSTPTVRVLRVKLNGIKTVIIGLNASEN